MSENPKVSVIVPVYNAGKWLRRCVDSILNQTFADFELLLVDDGSTDDSPAIADEYAAADARVRVFHKPNGGVSSARNMGLDHARGEWITFVDADDWVEPTYLAALLEVGDADLSVCSFRVEPEGERDFSMELPQRQWAGEEMSRFLAEKCTNAEFSAVMCKLYRAEIINKHGIRFRADISTREDSIFFLTYLSHVKRMATNPLKGYHYVAWNGLSMNCDNNSRQLPAILAAYEEVFARLNLGDKVKRDFMNVPVGVELQSIQRQKGFFRRLERARRLTRIAAVRSLAENTPPR